MKLWPKIEKRLEWGRAKSYFIGKPLNNTLKQAIMSQPNTVEYLHKRKISRKNWYLKFSAYLVASVHAKDFVSLLQREFEGSISNLKR